MKKFILMLAFALTFLLAGCTPKEVADTAATKANTEEVDFSKEAEFVAEEALTPDVVIAQKDVNMSKTKDKNQGKIVDVKKMKYDIKEYKKDVKALGKKYQDICEVKVIGKTTYNRPIYDIAIGNKDAKKSLVVVCEIHAREYCTTVLAMEQIEYYLKNYNKVLDGVDVSETLKDVKIHFIPALNPDGMVICQKRFPTLKANGVGVDLNMNFPDRFKVYGSSDDIVYSGPYALSEPESQAIADFLYELRDNKEVLGVINYHAQGQIVFGFTNGKDKKLEKDTNRVYELALKETGYGDSSSYVFSNKGRGSFRGFCLYKIKVPSITIEVGLHQAPVSYDQYDDIFKENKNLVIKEAALLKEMYCE